MAQQNSSSEEGLMDDETSHEFGWNVGRKILTARVDKQLRMKDVETLTKELDPAGRGISAGQISRIENTSELSMREFHLLCVALSLDPAELIAEPKRGPWEIVRKPKYEAALTDIRDTKYRPDRADKAHEIMYTRGVYRYLPLEPAADHHEETMAAILDQLIEPEERQGLLTPVMRKIIFEADWADDELMLKGAASHEGEEVVWMLDGEAELWLLKPSEKMSVGLREEYNRRRLHPEHFLVRTLRAGDCAHYESSIMHAYRAPQKGDSFRALFVYAAPRHLPVTREVFRMD